MMTFRIKRGSPIRKAQVAIRRRSGSDNLLFDFVDSDGLGTGAADSLNVSATAAVLFYEALRQRLSLRSSSTAEFPQPRPS